MKSQLIYLFYINNTACNDEIYCMHYYWINRISSFFDKMIFIFICDENSLPEVIYQVKCRIINECKKCKELKFITEKNNIEYKYGIYFKKYIIDKINEYNEYLTFIANTKCVSNDLCSNIQNTCKLIYASYYFNFVDIDEVYNKLTYPIYKYITYGSLYFKDYRIKNINNWMYNGGFFWINTKRFNDYIKENNIDINQYIIGKDALLKCPKLFIGSCLHNEYAGFFKDEKYNKNYMFHENTCNYSLNEIYVNADKYIKLCATVVDYNNFNNEFNLYKI